MELLERFINDAKIDSTEFYDYVENADNEELIEFLELFNDIIDDSTDSSTNKIGFNFIANSTLSGLPFPCEELSCRLENLDRLSRNSILYADTVYIQNPFHDYLRYKSFDKILRLGIIEDLIVLSYIRPLLKEGIFKFAKSKTHFCNDCYLKFQEKYLNSFDNNRRIAEGLIEEFIYQNVDFKLIRSYGKKCVELSGNNDLLNHPIIISFKKYVPASIDSLKINKKGIKLDQDTIKKSGLFHYLLDDVLNNITIQDFYSKYYSAHILTNREFDLQVLNLVNQNIPMSQSEQKRGEILKNIDHFVPYIGKISIEKLIKFRKNEGEAFQVYRDKINRSVKTGNLSQKEYNDLYLDEIQPELNKINLTLKNNRKHLWGNIRSNIFLATTYVSASLFTGLLPSNIDQIVAAIGGFSFAKGIGQDVIKLIKEPAIRENELYFLWKLQADNKIKI